MRGKDSVYLKAGGDVGITPAYAGKSHQFVDIAEMVWDHPRVCGEKKVL